MNYPTFFFDTNAVIEREGEMPDADFRGGCNIAGANAGGIGICTGVPDFKEQDFSFPSPPAIQRSSYIGWQDVPGVVVPTGISVGGGATGAPPTGENSLTAYLETSAEVPPDGVVDADVEGFEMVNLTGQTLPTGTRLWAVGAQPAP